MSVWEQDVIDELKAELAETELQVIALRAQRDGANNRVKYLEELLTTCANAAAKA